MGARPLASRRRPPCVGRWTSVAFGLRESSSVEVGTLSANVSRSRLKVSASIEIPWPDLFLFLALVLLGW